MWPLDRQVVRVLSSKHGLGSVPQTHHSLCFCHKFRSILRLPYINSDTFTIPQKAGLDGEYPRRVNLGRFQFHQLASMSYNSSRATNTRGKNILGANSDIKFRMKAAAIE